MSPPLRTTAGRLLFAFLLGAAPAAGAPPPTSSADAPARVVELHIDGEIDPVMAEYVDGGIDRANDGAALVLITMDTPGGLDTSMRDIIQHIIESRVPVVVYVTPAGSRAASAGFFILLSADIAAMAPGTHTGAASPLLAVGGYPVTVDETLKKKILNDATAYLRSFADRRGRNVALAETAITDAKAFTEREASTASCATSSRIPARRSSPSSTAGRSPVSAERRPGSRWRTPRSSTIEMTARQRFLARVVQPDVFFVLLLVGVLGLYTEFTHPGLVAPGVVGGIALLLALFAMHVLPINLAGLLLIGLALALFILEAKYHEPRRPRRGRRRRDAPRRPAAGAIAADRRGRQPRRRPRRDAALRRDHDRPDAPRAALAILECRRPAARNWCARWEKSEPIAVAGEGDGGGLGMVLRARRTVARGRQTGRDSAGARACAFAHGSA